MVLRAEAKETKPKEKASLVEAETTTEESSNVEPLFRHRQYGVAIVRLAMYALGVLTVCAVLAGVVAGLISAASQVFPTLLIVIPTVGVLLVLGIGFVFRELRSVVFYYEVHDDLRLRTLCGLRTIPMSSVARVNEFGPGDSRSFRPEHPGTIFELHLFDSERIALHVPTESKYRVLACLQPHINETNKRHQVLSRLTILGFTIFGLLISSAGLVWVIPIWQHGPVMNWWAMLLVHLPFGVGLFLIIYALYAWRRRRGIWQRI